MPGTALWVLALWLTAQAPSQQPFPPHRPDERPDVLLPSGKSQRQELLKADYKKAKSEASELVKLSQELKDAIDDGEHQVLSLRTVKKAEEVEKLARRIKDRLRRSY